MIIESTLLPENALTQQVVDAGDYYIGVVNAGETIRILDLEGNQAADTLFFNAHNPTERYSAMDTLCASRVLFTSRQVQSFDQILIT